MNADPVSRGWAHWATRIHRYSSSSSTTSNKPAVFPALVSFCSFFPRRRTRTPNQTAKKRNDAVTRNAKCICVERERERKRSKTWEEVKWEDWSHLLLNDASRKLSECCRWWCAVELDLAICLPTTLILSRRPYKNIAKLLQLNFHYQNPKRNEIKNMKRERER